MFTTHRPENCSIQSSCFVSAEIQRFFILNEQNSNCYGILWIILIVLSVISISFFQVNRRNCNSRLLYIPCDSVQSIINSTSIDHCMTAMKTSYQHVADTVDMRQRTYLRLICDVFITHCEHSHSRNLVSPETKKKNISGLLRSANDTEKQFASDSNCDPFIRIRLTHRSRLASFQWRTKQNRKKNFGNIICVWNQLFWIESHSVSECLCNLKANFFCERCAPDNPSGLGAHGKRKIAQKNRKQQTRKNVSRKWKPN